MSSRTPMASDGKNKTTSSSRAPVKTVSPPSLVELKSTRTAVPSAPVAPSGPPTNKMEEDGVEPSGLSQLIYTLQDYAIALILLVLAGLQYLLYIIGVVYIFLIGFAKKSYRAAVFCYNKPHHAWDLAQTTGHLLYVSYDAGLWNWTEAYQTVCRQMETIVATPVNSPKQQ